MSIDHLIISDLIRTGTQKDVATEYACLLDDAYMGHQPPWTEINRAIMDRWPKGLMRVKTMAWKIRSTR